MYKLKSLSVVCLLAVAAIFAGCGDKEDEKQSDIKVEDATALTQTVFADQTGGKSGVKIVTSGAWTSSIKEGSTKSTKAGDASWVGISPDHGDAAGAYTIAISLAPNATGEDRTATITITCNGEKISITVTQTATKENGDPYDATLESIAVTTQPTKTTYEVGEAFDPAGMIVTATYSDGSTAPVTVTAEMLTYDFSTAGENKSVMITYEDKTATVEGITVNVATTSCSDANFTGCGSSEEPFLIGTAAELAKLAELVNGSITNNDYSNKYYKLTSDIYLGVAPYNTGSGWISIGKSNSLPFRGVFDGDEKIISGLRINDSGLSDGGLFGTISGSDATVCNLNLLYINIISKNYAGGVAAVVSGGGNISNCYIDGSIVGNSFIGGVAGSVGGYITNCYSAVKIDGNNHSLGGVAGSLNGGSISNCTFTAYVDGKESVGGMAGSVSYSGNISNCYIPGSVVGNSDIGGVAGYVDGSSITNCYATGYVSGGVGVGSRNNTGGVAGYVKNGNIANCWAASTVTGSSSYTGGITGFIENSNVTNCYATGAIDGYGNVGGVAGYFDEGSRLANCYAIGRVEGSFSVGGVVGSCSSYNILGTDEIARCAALNPSVIRYSGSSTNFKRVAGYMGYMETDGILSNNVAWDGMTVINSVVTSINHADPNGADITAAQAKTQKTYEDLGWKFGNDDENPWKWGGASYPLPVLYWQDASTYPTLPEHLK